MLSVSQRLRRLPNLYLGRDSPKELSGDAFMDLGRSLLLARIGANDYENASKRWYNPLHHRELLLRFGYVVGRRCGW